MMKESITPNNMEKGWYRVTLKNAVTENCLDEFVLFDGIKWIIHPEFLKFGYSIVEEILFKDSDM
jgi:hypothetical protein